MRFQGRDCPRNCERRATPKNTTEPARFGKVRESYDPRVRRPAINGAALRRLKPTGRGVWEGDDDGISA